MESREESLKRMLAGAGAVAVGIAEAAPVDEAVTERFDRWLASGLNAGMDYMRNHQEIRRDPRLLIEGGKSIISMAFSYESGERRDPRLPGISAYALLPDYHNRIKNIVRRSGVGEILGEEGRDWRVFVDSAPIMERYWAVKAGVGIMGDNGSVIVPGAGSRVILAEIVSRLDLQPDKQSEGECLHCGRCRCEARTEDGLDCNRCLSYLTIEHRGEWTDPVHIAAMSSGKGRRTLFGCDRCIEACRMMPTSSKSANREIRPFAEPLKEILSLTAEKVMETSPEELAEAIRGSALKRAGITGLRRNAANISPKEISPREKSPE